MNTQNEKDQVATVETVKKVISETKKLVKTNTEGLNSAIETLNGSGDGSVKKIVTDEIAKVVADAPDDFNTLKEMSDWISSHESTAADMNSAINGKVDKDGSKVLSDNNFSDADKAKLAELENYELPKASDTALGGFKTGGSFSLDVDDTLVFTGDAQGKQGDSAYKIAQNNGYEGTEYEWVQSLVGKSAYQIWQENGHEDGTLADFLIDIKGEQGKSLYQSWLDLGNVGTEEDFLNAMKPENGKSAYELSGFTGTEAEWLETLKGNNGKSSYELWKDAGNSGTEEDYLLSLKGEKGLSPTATVTDLNGGAKITITDKDGTTEAEIHDGVGIASIIKTGTTGNVDTYTITYTDNTTTTFDVANGSGNEISKVSQLENDSEFITKIVDNLLNYYTKDNTYTKTEIEELIGRMSGGLSLKITSNLNAEIAEGVSTSVIYLVETAEGSGVYTQYIWMAGTSSWAMIGTTAVDLSNYYTKSEIDNRISLYATSYYVATLLASYTTTENLSKVAKSNNYNDLDNLPTIPSVSGLASETYVDTAVSNLSDNVTTTYRKSADKVPYADVSGTPELSTVATSGSYNDLSDKPTIPNAVTVDSTLSATSTNPVQNKVVQAALAGKADIFTVDSTLNSTSENPIANKAVYSALSGKQDSITIDTALSATSENPVQNKVIKNALDNVQITLDNGLSSTSENAVKNKVIYAKFLELENRLHYLQTAVQNMHVGGISSSQGVEISSGNALTSNFITDFTKNFKISMSYSISRLNTRYILLGDYTSRRYTMNFEPYDNNKLRLILCYGGDSSAGKYEWLNIGEDIEVDRKYDIILAWTAATNTVTVSVDGTKVHEAQCPSMAGIKGVDPLKIGSDYRTSFNVDMKIYNCQFEWI